MNVSLGLAVLVAKGRHLELFINFALQFMTHTSLLFTDTVEKAMCTCMCPVHGAVLNEKWLNEIDIETF